MAQLTPCSALLQSAIASASPATSGLRTRHHGARDVSDTCASASDTCASAFLTFMPCAFDISFAFSHLTFMPCASDLHAARLTFMTFYAMLRQTCVALFYPAALIASGPIIKRSAHNGICKRQRHRATSICTAGRFVYPHSHLPLLSLPSARRFGFVLFIIIILFFLLMCFTRVPFIPPPLLHSLT